MVKENKEETLKSRRAVSPVIATIIIVAVTITVAVAVAYWLSGIAGSYTAFEKVEIQSGYAVKVDDVIEVLYLAGDPEIGTVIDGVTIVAGMVRTPASGAGWIITLELKNSGTSTSTLINAFINEQIIGGVGLESVTCVGIVGGIGEIYDGITIDSGKSETITIGIVPSSFSSSGTTINVKLHSAAGMDYIRLLNLP